MGPICDERCVFQKSLSMLSMLTLVTFGDWIIWVVTTLSTTDNVSPPSPDFCACWNRYHGAIGVLNGFVASKAAIVDILDGVIARGGSHALELTLIGSINGNLLHDGMTTSSRSCKSSGEERLCLHG